MKVTTVMVVILILWCLLTLLERGGSLPPAPIPANLHFSNEALGWLKGTVWPTIAAVAIFVGFGHSILAMSGEESLAQVYREIERPKVKNLKRAGLVIFVYSLLFTALVSFFATAIIPDSVRPHFYDNLISGLAMNLVGPESLRLLFQAFVVVVGFLILAGAANTAIVGSNGVLNRVSEDGVMTDWFRKPHQRFGTTYRLINLIVILQIITILLSRGDVYLLGEAYAFGVIWSFAFNAVSVLILRYKRPDAPRPWRVPLNLKIGGRELPVGLLGIAAVLFACAVVNLFTKQVATVAGISFTLGFFVVFVVSERITARKRAAGSAMLDQFQLDTSKDIAGRSARHASRRRARARARLQHAESARLGSVAARVRGARRRRAHGARARAPASTARRAWTRRRCSRSTSSICSRRVVAVAERHGRKVTLLVAPGTNVFDALAQSAVQLKSSLIVVGESEMMTPERQALLVGEAWDRTPHDAELSTRFVVLCKDGRVKRFSLGAHTPDLSSADIERIHKLWVEAVKVVGPEIHHRDIVTAALAGMEDEFAGPHRGRVVDRLMGAAQLSQKAKVRSQK